jgi:hypothetical protein
MGKYNVWRREKFLHKGGWYVYGGIRECLGEQVVSERMSNAELEAMKRLPVPCTDPISDFPGYACDRASCSRNQYLQCLIRCASPRLNLGSFSRTVSCSTGVRSRAKDFYETGDFAGARDAYRVILRGDHTPKICKAPCFDTATQTLAENRMELSAAKVRSAGAHLPW